MPLNISRAMIDALLIKGAIWAPAPDGGLDLFLDGNAENKEIIRIALEALATIQIADLTQYLDDMEREYGLIPDSSLSETNRRARLKNAITDNQGYGTAWDMQAKLRAAGFTDIYVYQNDPPVDINLYVGNTANISCRTGFTATCGSLIAYCAASGGRLVVNGNVFFNQAPVTYQIPLQAYWHNVFFVGGQATFSDIERFFITCSNYQATCGNPVATCGNKITRSEITAIAQVSIPSSRREEVRRLVVKYKPIHSWGVLRILFV